MALISVVLMSALLIAMYLRYMNTAGLLVRIDTRLETALQNRWAAQAGLEYAISLLTAQRGIAKAYTDSWKLKSDATVEEPLRIGVSSCTVLIIDESSKANINRVNEDFLVKLFSFYDLGIAASFSIIGEEMDLGSSARLAQRILDYMDEDDSPRPLGAESSFYIEHGYLPPRNAPIEDIRELYNIPGVTEELFVASGTRPGLEDLLTVYGDGKINLNTAHEGVVRAVAGLPRDYDSDRVEDFYRQLLSRRPFIGVAAFTNFIVDFDWKIQQSYTRNFITATSWFRVSSEAVASELSCQLEALLFRDVYGDCHMLRISEIP